MPDWTKPMIHSYEYYIVDPATWKDIKPLSTVKSCSISRDEEAETLGSANINVTESIGECYIRVYLVTTQETVTERFPLGTFLAQTPSTAFNGKVKDITVDAYTPLIELKENPPPIGYSIFKNVNIMDKVYELTRENARAPVVAAKSPNTLFSDFIAETNDTWLSFLSILAANAKYKFDLDELGRILYSPVQDMASLQPVWTYTNDNSSILYPDISTEHDMYGIPNVVEVIYSNGTNQYYAKAVNDDINSPISTVNRGRKITHRITNPDLIGNPTENQIQEYAERTLSELSILEHKVTYTHGYCPVRKGDCVRLNYPEAGINNVKAKVISQNIKCETGCPVTEKAVFTTKLWR